MHRIFSPVRAALFVALCALPAAAQAVVSSPEEARALASRLAEAGNAPAAILLLQDELAKHPADTATRLQLARQLALSKRYNEAAETYSGVLAREPQNLAAKVGMAKVASWQGDLDRSLALYDDVLARSPHLYDARVGKGFTLAWMGRHDEAFTLLRSAAKVHPEDQEVAVEVERLAKLVRSTEPRQAPIQVVRKVPSPREAASQPAVAQAARPAEYPRTFAEPVSPAVALAPEPHPWIPIGAFAAVFFALGGVTMMVRKRIPATVPMPSPPVEVVVGSLIVPEPEAGKAAPPPAIRVLLVAANDDAAEFVRMVLTQHGATVARLTSVHEVLTHTHPVDLVIVGESCAPARAEELIRIAERAGSVLVFACNTSEEARAIHALGGESIRRPFRIMDLISLLAPSRTAETPLDAHTWRPAQADAASCERPFHSPPRPLQ
jgi:tetratricopeptide (TPR) repeat protein